MTKRELLSDKPNLGSLTEFIKMISMLSEKFNMGIVSIEHTNSDERDMSCSMDGYFGKVDLEYKYYDEKFYITVYPSGSEIESLEQFKKILKEEVEK